MAVTLGRVSIADWMTASHNRLPVTYAILASVSKSRYFVVEFDGHHSTPQLPDPENRLLNATISKKIIYYARRVIAYFVFKFRCHGNKGRSEVNFNNTVKLADLKAIP